MALSVTLNLLAGYVLAKYRFRGQQVVFVMIVSTLMIPVQVVMVPQFQLVAGLGWINSYWAVIVPRAAEAFGIFLCRQFMLGIPTRCSRPRGSTAPGTCGSSGRWCSR